MSRPRSEVPARLAWAVDLVDPAPGQRVLEVGCGPGVALALLAERAGHVTGIDRSATAVERARGRLGALVDDGRVVLEQTDLAGFSGSPATFDHVLAVNVNVFWTNDPVAECAVLARVLRPAGVVHLVYEGPGPTGGRDVGPAVADALAGHGFAASVLRHPTSTLLAVRATLPR